jgi:hypothetical protein
MSGNARMTKVRLTTSNLAVVRGERYEIERPMDGDSSRPVMIRVRNTEVTAFVLRACRMIRDVILWGICWTGSRPPHRIATSWTGSASISPRLTSTGRAARSGWHCSPQLKPLPGRSSLLSGSYGWAR